MTYYITGKDDATGTIDSDSSSLNVYFELGWEIMTTHCLVKQLLYNGTINNDDVIVTCSGREFLYEKSFNKVINWSEFKNLNPKPNAVYLLDDVINMVTRVEQEFKDPNLIELFRQFKKDEKIIENLNEKFVCLVYRNRSHCSHRNMDESYFRNIINFFNNELGLKTFVVGLGGEKFNSDKCDYISLKQFATLINHENCVLCLSSLTGPPHLTYFFGNRNLKNIILDLEHARQNPVMINHPLAMGDIFNYNNVPTEIIMGRPELSVLYQEIKKQLNIQ